MQFPGICESSIAARNMLLSHIHRSCPAAQVRTADATDSLQEPPFHWVLVADDTMIIVENVELLIALIELEI